MEIENRDDMNDIQDYLGSITGARSVPRVFINGNCIGGGDETAALARSGELEKLLKEVRAKSRAAKPSLSLCFATGRIVIVVMLRVSGRSGRSRSQVDVDRPTCAAADNSI